MLELVAGDNEEGDALFKINYEEFDYVKFCNLFDSFLKLAV